MRSDGSFHGATVLPFRTELPVSLECIGCGQRIEAVTYTRLRRLYVEHIPVCSHDRSAYNGCRPDRLRVPVRSWHGEAL